MKEDELVKHVAGKGEVRNAHRTPAGTVPLRRTELSWEIIKCYVNEIQGLYRFGELNLVGRLLNFMLMK
jgi:hypothetical protein